MAKPEFQIYERQNWRCVWPIENMF